MGSLLPFAARGYDGPVGPSILRRGEPSRGRRQFSPGLSGDFPLEGRCLLTSNVSLAVKMSGALVGPVQRTPSPAQILESVSERSLDPKDGLTKFDMKLKNVGGRKDATPGPVQVLFGDL